MISCIIVAAGKGTRMGAGIDKIFLEVAGRPLIAHTWQRVEDAHEIDEIILVVREGMEQEFRKIAGQYGFRKSHRFAAGGAERQDSVWNGLQTLNPNCEIVAIQDGARPCTSQKIISDTIWAARQMGAAVAAQKITDTIKEADAAQNILRNVDRSKLWAVQTPQVFRKDVIWRALSAVLERDLLVTDDTAACE